ncbi:MAG: FAD-dependent oxidoreductase [Gemmatimonadetes bacterium]|uniref:FAD-dependent oxidoreductase n=1 Tax=Candidatus Kutchimonas denitrificans TaxID=3056748 RepID=A0AAE4Z7W4_9BACT|nr:FAD-dependent oxidoreductase [Gemmatimonadota bacterium]NIR74869.1 FAD-dependent oxidoreductase [Candidatus Kutchimonas denitrificans]NIR99980.1 FAD-dependent oxidoreductase [Gemmatimonadota bacterium]NIT65564.1 FAD-dependent oxidoreductase [Gemmatimonadota bacterium]NIU52534.1 FAD-dependent oxidoreductase [Gemmatimonadota bacterium]
MTVRDADVIVVGGGPAGSAVALRLARGGHDVMVLERAAFPRDKPCGDCVNPGAVAELEALGLASELAERLEPQGLKGWSIEAPNGRRFRAEFGVGETGWAVRRRDFDAALLAEAELAGARVSHGARVFGLVTGTENRVVGVRFRRGGAVGELRSSLVVGADGLRSVVQRRLGLASRPPRLRKIAIVGHLAGPNGAGDRGELRVRVGRSCGYAPFAEGGNVTLVVPRSDAAAMGGNPRRFLERGLGAFPEIERRVRSAGLEDDVLVTGPFDRPVRRAWAPGAVLVGDAAGYYDPFTGQGIHQALRSARLAAAAIAVALEDSDAANASLRRYDWRLRFELAPTRALQRTIESVIRRPGLMGWLVAAMAANPALATRLIRATGDLTHPAAVLDPRLWLRALPSLIGEL